MPHSPYDDAVYPPIQDLEEYRQDLRKLRSGFEEGERDKHMLHELLQCGESLLAHCDFLDKKLEIKIRVYWWIKISVPLSEVLYSGKTANEADLLSM
jgi:hypothetical protein